MDSARKIIQLLYELQNKSEAQHASGATGYLSPQMLQLREWQSQRLARTYSDLADDPQYQSACRFFLDEIYSARDFSRRDHDAERLQSILIRYLPAEMLRLLNDAVELNRLSLKLDQSLLNALLAVDGEPLVITPRSYAAAYRSCDNYDERKAQINILVRVLEEAATGARSKPFAVGLRMARRPSLRLGWDELYAFLESGYTACKPMRDVSRFVETIRQRETELLEDIFSEAESNY